YVGTPTLASVLWWPHVCVAFVRKGPREPRICNETCRMKRVVIVGAGISGLALAHALRRRSAERGQPVEVLVLEKSDRAGGNIRSERPSGYLCEWGPNGFLDNVPETLELVRDLGMQDRIQVSDDAARRRFI